MGQRQTVLTMLEDAGERGVTSNTFFASHLPRFSARIHELRNAGHTITKEPVEQGHFLYRLVKVSATTTQTDPSLCVRAVHGGADLGQSPSTPERGRERQLATAAGESSNSLAHPSSSPGQAGAMAASGDAADVTTIGRPEQTTDGAGSSREPAPLLLFEMTPNRYADAA